jgi:hypothetical protein
MQRPNDREFLAAVLETMDDLPEGFAERLVALIAEGGEERAQAIRQLIEESTRE